MKKVIVTTFSILLFVAIFLSFMTSGYVYRPGDYMKK